MKDWAAGSESRNYGIRNGSNPGLSDMLRTIILFLPIAGVLLFHAWVKAQITTTGTKNQEFRIKEETLLREQRYLTAKENMLRRPDVIATRAGKEFNMALLRPNQILPAPNMAQPDNSVLAMTNSKASGLKRD